MATLTGGAFVGRQQEMGSLKAALEDTISGQGRLIMLVGEPGIGKTRTAEELATLARQQGAAALWGRCPEERGAPPFWPWVQIIRSYMGEREPGTLRSQLGAGAADIAHVVSEMREVLPELPPLPPMQDPEQARFRLFDSITSFLKQASHKQPLLLVLDNLHWADPSSLRLLEFTAQELAEARVLVIGTYRDIEVSRGHPLYHTLGELTHQRLYQRVLLRGMNQGDVGRVMETVGKVGLPQELVATVHQHTGGNPLFVGEVVRLLAQEGLLLPERLDDLKGWDFRLPEGIREVIGRRLDRLSGRCNEILPIASVIGREFSIRLLGQIVQQPEEQVLEVLEEALAARIIEELPRPVGRYQFTHALIQETLASELTTTRKVRLHARIAESLEKLYGQQAEAHAAELAQHFAEAEAVLGAEKLVQYSLLAGEKALAAYAWEEALQHFQRGLEGKGVRLQGIEPAEDAETAALLFGLARAQLATLERHEMREAMPSLRRAFDHYIQAGDIAQAIAVVEYPAPSQAEVHIELAQLLSRALALVPPDSHSAGRLLSAYGRCISFRGDYQGTQQAFQRALAIARRERDLALEVRTLAYAARGESRYLRYGECVEKSLRAIELARSVDEPRIELQAGVWGAESLLALGELEQARRLTETSLALAEKLRQRYELVIALRSHMTLSRLEGDWPAARESGQRGLAVSPNDNTLLSGFALLEYQLGDFGQGEAYLDQWLELARLTLPDHPSATFALQAVVIPVVARIAGTASRAGVAQERAKAVLSVPSVDLYAAVIARAGLGLLAVQRSDGKAAREQYTSLEPQRGTMLESAEVAFDRLLGLLVQTMGNLDKAAEHFEDALAFCRRAGYRPELAWSLCDYAEMLLQRNKPGDKRKGMSLLDEALAVSSELSMRPLTGRVIALQERAQPQLAKALAYPAGLTEREVEVLRLIAEGCSNREIADKLVISLRTVANHVANILNKTNSANRAEAASFATREGLA